MAFVVEPGVQVLLTFSDASGHKSSMSIYMDNTETDPTAGGPAAVASAAQDISADALTAVECRIRAKQTAIIAPTDGPYPRGADKAQYVFGGADGSPVVLQVGAPNEGTLQSDKINIDPTDAAVIALVAALVGNGKTAEGQAITGLVRGFRKRNSHRKGL